MYEALMAELSPGRWLLAPDTPGFGASDPLNVSPTIAAYSQAFLAWLDALQIERCDLFGFHTGAAIAVHMAWERPGCVRSLVLGGPPLLTQEQVTSLRQGLQASPPEAGGEHLLRVWRRLRGRDPQASLELTQREALLTLQAWQQAPLAYEAVFNQDFAAQLAALDIPVLVFAGEHDTLRASLEPAYALLRHGQVALIPGGNSYVCDHMPAQVASLLEAFLAPL